VFIVWTIDEIFIEGSGEGWVNDVDKPPLEYNIDHRRDFQTNE
jgi:hypothetical protein